MSCIIAISIEQRQGTDRMLIHNSREYRNWAEDVEMKSTTLLECRFIPDVVALKWLSCVIVNYLETLPKSNRDYPFRGEGFGRDEETE